MQQTQEPNARPLWFRRKRYGWGWTPATWQGWLVTLAYAALVVAFVATVDDRSSPREVAFTALLPIAILTAAFFRVAVRMGERPRWQWGGDGR
jgi:hypothetical protein